MRRQLESKMTPIDSRGESKMQRSTASMKKALGGDANKHRACGAQNFSPRRRPLPGGAGRPKFNQLEMVTTFTYKPSLVRIDARNFELSW